MNPATKHHHRSCKISCSWRKLQFLLPFVWKSKGWSQIVPTSAWGNCFAERKKRGWGEEGKPDGYVCVRGGFSKAPALAKNAQRTAFFFLHNFKMLYFFFYEVIITQCLEWQSLSGIQIIELVTKNSIFPFITTHILSFMCANQCNENTKTDLTCSSYGNTTLRAL